VKRFTFPIAEDLAEGEFVYRRSNNSSILPSRICPAQFAVMIQIKPP
jgi:hypothetical protein